MSAPPNKSWQGLPNDPAKPLPEGWFWRVRRNPEGHGEIRLELVDGETEDVVKWHYVAPYQVRSETALQRWVWEHAHLIWDELWREKELDRWLEAKSWQ
ncbi:hypothetical protein [Mycobacterium sp. AZCC_0083]|uniref:hypothetical protein n=1 Tax=Mycobacterium sp. AZCC_0083 TaxID=2735882 RepID=UPI0016181EAE|nr:hypothetical protein [Mycobacterium sp. AZCC_0083]MBB5167221.1 hypothetical protein [Mycobacterium sp. AZCC_0083]